MEIKEIQRKAKLAKDNGDFDEALALYKQLWDLQKNAWTGYFIAQCYRKKQNYEKASKSLKLLKSMFPNFKPINNEYAWLFYYEKIKEPEKSEIKITNANILLPKIDVNNKYVKNIYIKTIFEVAASLYQEEKYYDSFQWLIKLDKIKLSNSAFDKNHPADKKKFFLFLTNLLIKMDQHRNYIDSFLKILMFEKSRLSSFKNYIMNEIDNYDNISVYKLAKYIKGFHEEFHFRNQNNITQQFEENNIIHVSDLSHYLFCPVSFAINSSFKIESESSWDKDEIVNEKILFIDRYKAFKKEKDYSSCFSDSNIFFDSYIKKVFDYFFDSKILVNNATNPKPIIYKNKKGTLIGAPDYVMETKNNIRYVITEKFRYLNLSKTKKSFESDLVKHYAFLNEFEQLNLSLGFLITWFWEFETMKDSKFKKIKITSVKIDQIERNNNNSRILKETINAINNFKVNKTISINISELPSANKCLHCSVFPYCHHKTGKFNKISLPYEKDIFTISKKPSIKFTKVNSSKNDILIS